MAETFTKLLSSITDSSIWGLDDQTRIVWITLLAMADQNGVVHAAVPGIANRARVPLKATEKALEVFQEPDPYSRDPDHEGRRIKPVDRGYQLLNYCKVRTIRDAERRREQVREAVRRHRARKAEGEDSCNQNCNQSNQCKPRLSQAEADTEAEEESTTKLERTTLQKSGTTDNQKPHWSPSAGDKGDRSSSKKKIPPERLADLEALIESWNAQAERSGLRSVRPETILNPTTEAGRKRRSTALKRLEEYPDLGRWKVVISRIGQREHCRGENESGWVADFEYLTRVNTFQDHYDGKFSKPAKRYDPSGDLSRWNE